MPPRTRRRRGHIEQLPSGQLLIRTRRHLERVLAVYVERYNSARPHRSLSLQTPLPASPVPARTGRVEQMHRVNRLGGLIHEYRHAA